MNLTEEPYVTVGLMYCPDCGEPEHEHWWDCKARNPKHSHGIKPPREWREGLGGER